MTNGFRRELRVAVTDGLGRPLRAPSLRAWLGRIWATRMWRPASAGMWGPALAGPLGLRSADVAVALVSDAAVRVLNRRYRREDRVTDVLSFPAERGREHFSGGREKKNAPVPFLGDIVIATGRARQQARAAGHSFENELKVLALHGLLHLVGHDHERDEGEMARLERRLRRRGGLEGGLIERGAR